MWSGLFLSNVKLGLQFFNYILLIGNFTVCRFYCNLRRVVLHLAFPSEQLRRRPSACGWEMGDLFNTLNKSLPRRTSKALEGQFLCCAVTLSVTLYSQMRCVSIFRKMFSCLRSSDRRQSDETGHVCGFYLFLFILHALRRADNAYFVGEIYSVRSLVSDSLLGKDFFR